MEMTFWWFVIGCGFGFFLGYMFGYGKAYRDEAKRIRKQRELRHVEPAGDLPIGILISSNALPIEIKDCTFYESPPNK